MSHEPFVDAPTDAPVLVAVINHPEDLDRARTLGWYRIPLSRAPARIGAEFIAFYQTAAFPPEERWSVRWIAAVHGYHLTTRRELIPEQSAHPRADDRYYRVSVGEVLPLPRSVPSRRLRRITFIRTTLGRLLEAREINDLWVHTPAQERLWHALQQADLADQVEHEYPLVEDLPYAADFAVFPEDSGDPLAIITVDAAQDREDCIREGADLDYPLARGGWRSVFVDVWDGQSLAHCLECIHQIRRHSVQA